MYNSTLAGAHAVVAMILANVTILFSYIHTEEYADTKRKFQTIVVRLSKSWVIILLLVDILLMAKPAAANVNFLVITGFINLVLIQVFMQMSTSIYRRRAKRKGQP